MNNSGPSRLLIADLLAPATIILELKASNRDEALQELVGRIPEIQSNPKAQETLLTALREREQLHSTGIGDGIALPHARNALVGLVDRPIIVFGRHQTGINFGAVDGLPAKLFFLLVAPTVTTHLQMLSRISRILRDARVHRSLMAADTPDKIPTIVRDAEMHL